MLIFLAALLKLAEILILVRVVLSFVPQWQRQPFGLLVVALTEPILRPLRSAIPVGNSGISLDFSPMIALFIIQIIRTLI
ncbi:MAG: YggT family protein [Abitibacteriaceae bacterium]|nr:YggT family protein [Abditibacteriaceae bacterium]